MITSTLVMPMIAITTLATVMFIGLGFLPRPSRATAMWSAAFTCAMIGAYAWLAQSLVFAAELRAIGASLVITPMALLWSGLRAYRGRERQFGMLSLGYVVVMTAALWGSTYIGLYTVMFRVLYVATAVFAVLLILELIGLGPQLRDEATSLLAASAGYLVFTILTLVNGFLQAMGQVDPQTSLHFIRTANLIGVNAYTVCALVTTLLLTTRTAGGSAAPHQDFERIARGRLARAQAAGDRWWSLLEIRLDDPDDIRLATSSAAFNAVCEKFARDVDSIFPADTDIERLSPTGFVVLVPRPQGGIRDLLTDLLDRVSSPESAQWLPMRLSASIGWAPAAVVGHDFDILMAAAAQAATTARTKGGDRWERIHGPDE